MNDSVHLVSEEPLENIVMQYANVCQGIGCLHGQYELEVDSTVTPVQVRPRNISLSLKDDVKAKLDTLEEQGMIEKVENPTQCASHLQPVTKPTGIVRLCLDCKISIKLREETTSRCQPSKSYCLISQKQRCPTCAMRKTVT